MRTRNRGQIAALEAKLQAANEQCAQMEQERNTANRQVISELFFKPLHFKLCGHQASLVSW